MKKLIAILCLISVCFACSSCDPAGHKAGDWLEPEKIESVELIQYENNEQMRFESWPESNYKFKQLLHFDESKVTVIEVLDEDKLPSFSESLSEMFIWSGYYLYNSPKDICVRINYSDGSYTVIYANPEEGYKGKGFVAEYSSDGEIEIYRGSVGVIAEYNELLELFEYDPMDT